MKIVRFTAGPYYCAVWSESTEQYPGVKENPVITVPEEDVPHKQNEINVYVDVDKGFAFLNFQFKEIVKKGRVDHKALFRAWKSAGFPLRWEVNPHAPKMG